MAVPPFRPPDIEVIGTGVVSGAIVVITFLAIVTEIAGERPAAGAAESVPIASLGG